MRYFLFLLSLLFFIPILSFAQYEEVDIYETQIDPFSGIQVMSRDSSYFMNFRFRVQNRFEAEGDDVERPWETDRHVFLTRRVRLRTDGYVVNPHFRYSLQLSFTQGDQDFSTTRTPNIVRDAIFYYRPGNQKLEIGFGLTKLPGNRQRIISSSEQQLVDRSILNVNMNVDRDHGIFMRFKDDFSGVPFRIHAAVTNGTGRNYDERSGGLALSGKFELLPFGDFKFNGDYFDGDFVREQKPKLSLSTAYSYNQKAIRTGGQTGFPLYQSSDMTTYFADMLFKYRGFAFFLEYANRWAENPVTFAPDPAISPRIINDGQAFNLQMSYQFKNRNELIWRSAGFRPNDTIQAFQHTITDHTLGITRYVRFHRVKVQADVTYRDMQSSVLEEKQFLLYRFQIEMGI